MDIFKILRAAANETLKTGTQRVPVFNVRWSNMSNKFLSTILLLLAVLFAVILFARKTEYFQSIDASLTIIPPPTGSKALPSVHIDMSGNGFPVSISNIGDITSAVQANNQAKTQSGAPSASQLQTNMDMTAELWSILQEQKQDKRMFDCSAMSGDNYDDGDDNY